MPTSDCFGRRQCIPIIYTKGTHYEVGHDMGRTFSGMIQELLQISTTLNNEYLPSYGTPEGKKSYDDTLNCVKANFPQYVRELEGIADGAQVPFYKLFLLHMDRIICTHSSEECKATSEACSTVCLNEKGHEILGHNEDTLSKENMNHNYIASVHIISDKPEGKWKVKEEKFTALCLAGHIAGYTMGYNYHGLVASVNAISARNLMPGKIPRHFLTRALLSAENFSKAEMILKDQGCGVGDACSINMTFMKEPNRVFYNVELGPAVKTDATQLDIIKAGPGEYLMHANTYLRMKLEEAKPYPSSVARMEAFNRHGAPKTKKDVIEMIGDTSNSKYPVFRDGPEENTMVVGIFDCVEKTWSLYSDNPKNNQPLVVLPLLLQ